MRRLVLVVTYAEALVGPQFIADTVLDIEGVDSVRDEVDMEVPS